MNPLHCIIVTFVPLFLSFSNASAWQCQHQINNVFVSGEALAKRPFSNVGPLRSSAAHTAQVSGKLNMDARPEGENTEGGKKCIGEMDLLHDDDALIVINKPAGVPIFPSPPASVGPKIDSVLERLVAHYKALSDSVAIPETLRSLCLASEEGSPQGKTPPGSSLGAQEEGEPTPHADAVVHRLDQGTSGVLLLAKTEAAALSLRQQFRERRVKKTYFAVTQGRLKGPMTVTSCIGRASNGRRKMQSACQLWSVHETATRAAPGKLRGAITLFKPLLCNGKWSVVLACPVTGRTHQIRLHLQMLKTPIIGDPLYGDASATSAFLASAVALRSRPRLLSSGGPTDPEGPQPVACPQPRSPLTKALGRGHLRPLLHAAEVCCMHPATAERLQVSAPLPPEMREAIGVVDPHWPAVPELAPFAGEIQEGPLKGPS
ncbi:RNA pseudouridylate synthase, putative [Eimeria brunetti]|uniref:RNA pseudouridylate synthase, putative n=1 Tax=Eimeria brunetti TaxID=51314 RepID=U6L867_9EIME|nr:RNA pseudouridylate synthase, putative [Eimeria brunetti]